MLPDRVSIGAKLRSTSVRELYCSRSMGNKELFNVKNASQEAVCGMQCGGCKYLGDGCRGCEAERGAPFWTSFVGIQACPVYGCCSGRRYEHCGCCAEMPCGKFTEIRDPEMTDAQVAENLEQRRLALLARRSDSVK